MRQVKGELFADYVRMIRGFKTGKWSFHLSEEDLAYTMKRIEPQGWYPMEVFERLGNAILKEVAKGDVEAVRMWGRFSVDQLRSVTPSLVSDGDPVETLMRFRVLRSTYFDFDALKIETLTENHARIIISYHMGPTAEEAASFQTMGFFERLLEVAGGKDVAARFVTRSWLRESATLLELGWTT